jgi:hypothetical protein
MRLKKVLTLALIAACGMGLLVRQNLKKQNKL